MFLVDTVIVVAELVHENVQKHECPSLRFREPTRYAVLQPVIRNAKPFKNILVGIKIGRQKLYPKIVPPRMKKNRTGFLTVIKLI